jgi:hypothetical protein
LLVAAELFLQLQEELAKECERSSAPREHLLQLLQAIKVRSAFKEEAGVNARLFFRTETVRIFEASYNDPRGSACHLQEKGTILF